MLLQAQVAEREREARRGARMARKKERKTKKAIGGLVVALRSRHAYQRTGAGAC